MANQRLLFVVNVDWFFLSHRLPLALAAIEKGYEVHVATTLTQEKATLESHGIIVHHLDLQRGSANIGSNLKTFFQILKLFRRLSPDIIHLVTIKPVLLGGIAAHFSKPKLVIAAISGLGTTFIANGLFAKIRRLIVKILYRLALSHKDLRIIVQNTTDQKLICHLAKIPTSKSILVPGSGVNLADYRHTPLPEGKPVIMLAARLLIDKGVFEFLDAIKRIRARNRTLFNACRFVLVGAPDPDNPSSITTDMLDQWQSEQLIEWWGHQNNMSEILPQAHIVVLPSYREGHPKVLAEAAACGRAVITTDVPGCRDAIIPHKTGILVPAKESELLSEKMEELIEDRSKCIAMGNAGRHLAEQSFDIQHVVDAHLDVYESVKY